MRSSPSPLSLPFLLLLGACTSSDPGDTAGQATADDWEVDAISEAAIANLQASLEDWEASYLEALDWDTAVEEGLWTDPVLRKAIAAVDSAWTSAAARRSDGSCDDTEEASADELKRQMINMCRLYQPISIEVTGGYSGGVAVSVDLGARAAGEESGLSGGEVTSVALDCEEEGEPASADDWVANNPCYQDDCLVNLTEEWGEHCGEADSFGIFFENACEEPLSVKWCLEESDGSWDCGITTADPGEVAGNGAWTCSGTGSYWVQAVLEGSYSDSCPFVGTPE